MIKTLAEIPYLLKIKKRGGFNCHSILCHNAVWLITDSLTDDTMNRNV